MIKVIKHSIKALSIFLGKNLFSPSVGGGVPKVIGRGLLLILLLIKFSFSNAQTVTIPNPDWPLDSVVNGAVHFYSVQGDKNFLLPSTFVWEVNGGRLFYDQALTQIAGDGITASVLGNSENKTTLWVVWDSFDQPLDTGYVFLYEISADGCQRSNSDVGKFVGMQIKVSAPPKVRFLASETLTCSYDDGVAVNLEIEGMPPFDLKYSINDEIFNWHINPEDLVDADFNGQVNNVTIQINDYTGTTLDKIYQLELLEASSGGVLGSILPDYPTHTVYAFAQPDPPVISPDWVDVTTGVRHTMRLSDPGIGGVEWFWEFYNEFGELMYEASSKTEYSTSIPFDFPPGNYNLISYFRSQNGCLSLSDTLGMIIYPLPAIAFADSSDHAIGCSAVTMNPDDAFEFFIDYQGALSYDFTYAIYDFNNVMLSDSTVTFVMNRAFNITIPNTFINDYIPEQNRVWYVKILNGRNGEGVSIEVLDQGIYGGRDERTITIHPKPMIIDDIDFAN